MNSKVEAKTERILEIDGRFYDTKTKKTKISYSLQSILNLMV